MAGTYQANEGASSSPQGSGIYGDIQYGFGCICSIDGQQCPELQMAFGESYRIKRKTTVMDTGGDTAYLGFTFFLWKIKRKDRA